MKKTHNAPPVTVYRPSELVGLNVRRLRKQRNWSQKGLADRLNELLNDTPQWAIDLYEARQEDPGREPDSRERRPRRPNTEPSNWTQVKVARLEKGKVRRVSLEEVFELAMALDVAPVLLMAYGQDESGVPLRIRLSPTKFAWPREMRSWIRGAHPILSSIAYRTDADAMAGIHFYAVGSQALGELEQDAEKGEELRSKWRPLTDLLKEDDDAE
jgi:transcriptional regulator with XRE-family HTH domain